MTASQLRALPALARHVVRTTPWVNVLAGCLTGTALLWLLRYVAAKGHWSVDQNTMRFAALPVLAGLAFVPRTACRPVIDATPLPARLTSAGQTLFPLPVLALTFWVQLLLIRPRGVRGVVVHSPAIYPLLAQLIGWCALTVAVAACCDRSRYADLGGAVAAPVSLALIALGTYGPRIDHLLASPPATQHATTVAWYVIAVVALAATFAAMGDRWPRYLRRPSSRRRA